MLPVLPATVGSRSTHKSRFRLDEDYHPSRSEEDGEALDQGGVVGYLEQHGSDVDDVCAMSERRRG